MKRFKMNFFIFLNFYLVLSVFGYEYSSNSNGVYGYRGSGRYQSCSEITSASRCVNHRCPGIGNVCKWNGRNRCSCQEGTCSDYKVDCESYSCPYTGNQCVYNENTYSCSCQAQVQTYTAIPTTSYTQPEPYQFEQSPLPGCQNSTDTNGFVNLDPGDDVVYPLPYKFRYLGTNYNQLYLNTNGVIYFVQHLAYIGSSIPCGSVHIGPLIAFYWADWDMTFQGLDKYKITSDHNDLKSAEEYIKLGWPSEYEYLRLTQGLIISFEDVPWWNAPTPSNNCPGDLLRNSVQVTLVTNGCREYFLIIEYKRIDWGGTSCTCYGWNWHVTANLDSGSFAVPISKNACTSKIINIDQESNVGVPGYFVFKVGEKVVAPTPSSDVSVSSLEVQAAEVEPLSEPRPQSSFLKE